MNKLIRIFLSIIILGELVSCSSDHPKGNASFSSLGVEMVAHKAVHFDSIAPPNSIDAILLAHRAGFKTIEIDLNRTKDNQIILLHDNHLHETFRIAEGYTPIDISDSITYCLDIPFEELQSKFVFASPNPAMRQSVTTYEEALGLIKSLNIFPYLEFKQMSFEDRLDVVYDAIDTAERVLGKNNFIVTCWGQYVCENIRKRYPHLVVCCDPVHDYTILDKNRFSYFPYWEEIDQEIVNRQHQEGYTVSTWTVDRTVFDSVLSYNIDKILTDNIAPAFDKNNAIFTDHSDVQFEAYSFDGKLDKGTLVLKKGNSAELDLSHIETIPFGAIHFSLQMKGEIVIESDDFKVERINQDKDFKIFAFQYMIHQKKPNFKITALEDSEIKSIWYAVSKY